MRQIVEVDLLHSAAHAVSRTRGPPAVSRAREPPAVSRTPQQFVDEGHPAGCRTEFSAAGDKTPLGYQTETRALGEDLAGAVEQALGSSTPSRTTTIWGGRSDVCVPLTNVLFSAAAVAGVFGDRPGYADNCTVQVPALVQGSTAGNEKGA